MSTTTTRQFIRRKLNRMMMRRSPACAETARLISESIDRRLTVREWFVMRFHLFACAPCVRYLSQSKFLSGALKALASDDQNGAGCDKMNEAARERIKSGLRSAAAFLLIYSPLTKGFFDGI